MSWDDGDLDGLDLHDGGGDLDAAVELFPELGGSDSDEIAGPGVVSDPEGNLAAWHHQEQPKSCAVACQEFVLDEFTGVDHTEQALREVAEQHGRYTPGGGTPMGDTGKILEYYGIDTEQHHGATFDQLEAALADGDGVIVGIDSSEIWNPGFDPDDSITDYLGIPGQGADHAVQVVGVDHVDPANPQVILNDPGTPGGQGERVPLAVFLDAWEDAGNFLVTAQLPGADPQKNAMPADYDVGVRFGTSWTVDGTSEASHAVEWSTSYNGYYDQVTGEQVVPK